MSVSDASDGAGHGSDLPLSESGWERKVVANRRIGVVGCVKQKAPNARPARDLYISTLFMGRRNYVEQTCTEWWILSAEHGLVDPAEQLAPYDLALKDLSRGERREWSQSVLRAFDAAVAHEPGDIVEVHAGAEYREFGLEQGLRDRGLDVVNPTEGMGIGVQLRFYKEFYRK